MKSKRMVLASGIEVSVLYDPSVVDDKEKMFCTPCDQRFPLDNFPLYRNRAKTDRNAGYYLFRFKCKKCYSKKLGAIYKAKYAADPLFREKEKNRIKAYYRLKKSNLLPTMPSA